MGEQGLRRAIKFSSRRELNSPELLSKGQRCTPLVVAAYQAAILAPIVKLSKKHEHSFKDYRNKSFLDYANHVLINDWQETELGKKLLTAYEQNDYSNLFTEPFAIDLRYALPDTLSQAMNNSENFELVGRVIYSSNKLEMTNSEGDVLEYEFDTMRSPHFP